MSSSTTFDCNLFLKVIRADDHDPKTRSVTAAPSSGSLIVAEKGFVRSDFTQLGLSLAGLTCSVQSGSAATFWLSCSPCSCLR
jgi:hypothetical protein